MLRPAFDFSFRLMLGRSSLLVCSLCCIRVVHAHDYNVVNRSYIRIDWPALRATLSPLSNKLCTSKCSEVLSLPAPEK